MTYKAQHFELFPGVIPKEEALYLGARIRELAALKIHFGAESALDRLSVRSEILDVVHQCIGPKVWSIHNIRPQIEKFRSNWHRDCSNKVFGRGRDWNPEVEYRCLKVIMYFEATNEPLQIIPGSYYKDLNPKLVQPGKVVTLRANPGDIIAFDMRQLHRGKPTSNAKVVHQLSYGGQDHHSQRFYSYMHHLRGFPPFSDVHREMLSDEGMLPPDTDYFAKFPKELSTVQVPKPRRTP